jgi:tRNA pseudouridine synthase 9
VIKNGDYLEHIMHRHEAPVHVPAQLDGIVQYKDERIVIVNKPASVPVHPGGSYRYNSLIFLLRHELNIPDLYPVHRIDRLTSGLLIFGTSSINTRDISEEIMKGQVRKFYLAKVLGEFPLMDDGMKHTSDGDYDAIGTFLPNHLPIGDVRKTNNGFWKLSAPIGCISAKENLRGVTEDGKESETLFRRLAFDGKHSIVQCIPLTGRTHQIRLHLRLLGFPIGNDPVYGPKSFLEELNRLEESEVVTQFSSTNKNSKVNDEEREEREPTVEKYCEVCVKGEVACFNWIQRKCLGMWLHSYRYEGPTWQYQVDLPPWASSVKHLV